MNSHRPQPAAALRPASLHQLADSGPPFCDHILLCCFGPNLAQTQPRGLLHAVLRHAGYPGSLARHLIRTSPLLAREPGRRDRLKHRDE